MTPPARPPAAGPAGHRNRPAAGRLAASALLWALAVLLVGAGAISVGAAVTGRGGGGGGGVAGVGFLFTTAVAAGSGARAVARGGAATVAAIGLGRAPGRGGAPGGRAVLAPLPAASREVTYTERCSQFPALGALICGALLAASVAGLIEIGGPNGPGGRGGGPAGFFFVLGALAGAVYLALTAADLANGILISAGRFTIGARGVPPAGRLWRRISGPLDAVLSWEVLSREQVRGLTAGRVAQARSGRRRIYLGDLRMFGRRQVLRLTVDPARASARLPARIQAGYVSVPAARAGAVWDGVILIGTRRPAALAAALEQALPARAGARGASP